jgi:hypothetical protein
MAVELSSTQPVAMKKEYQSPKLTTFGELTKLTQNGSGGTKENNGKAICGATFALSGGTAC